MANKQTKSYSLSDDAVSVIEKVQKDYQKKEGVEIKASAALERILMKVKSKGLKI